MFDTYMTALNDPFRAEHSLQKMEQEKKRSSRCTVDMSLYHLDEYFVQINHDDKYFNIMHSQKCQ